MLYNPATLDEWAAVVRSAMPHLNEDCCLALAQCFMHRHPGRPDVQVHDGSIDVSDPNATVVSGWERLVV